MGLLSLQILIPLLGRGAPFPFLSSKHRSDSRTAPGETKALLWVVRPYDGDIRALFEKLAAWRSDLATKCIQAVRSTRVLISLRSAPKSIGLVKSASAPLSNTLRFVSASP